jgi:hypothetical protein
MRFFLCLAFETSFCFFCAAQNIKKSYGTENFPFSTGFFFPFFSFFFCCHEMKIFLCTTQKNEDFFPCKTVMKKTKQNLRDESSTIRAKVCERRKKSKSDQASVFISSPYRREKLVLTKEHDLTTFLCRFSALLHPSSFFLL